MAMDKTVRIVTDLEEQQAETYRYGQSVSDGERMGATWNQKYRLKGLFLPNQGMQKSVVRLHQGSKSSQDAETDFKK